MFLFVSDSYSFRIVIWFPYLIAAAHAAGPGHGLYVADDLLPDDRSMLRQESLTPGGEHLWQC